MTAAKWFHHPFGSEWRWQLSSLLSLPSYSPFLLVPWEGEVRFLLLVFDRSQSGIADKLSLIGSTFSKSLARRTRLLEFFWFFFFFFFFLSSSWSLLTGGFYNVLRPMQDSKEIWGTHNMLFVVQILISWAVYILLATLQRCPVFFCVLSSYPGHFIIKERM